MTQAGFHDAPERRVLVCADGSEQGELARLWARQWARDLGVELLTLHENPTITAATLAPAHSNDLLILGFDFADGKGRVTQATENLIAATSCLTILMRTPCDSQEPVTAAVSGHPNDGAVLAAAVDLAALCRVEVHLLHARPLPLRHSDSLGEHRAGQTILEAARRQTLVLSPDCMPTTQLLRVHAHEAISHHRGGLLVLGAKRSPHPGLGLVTRTALHHASSPVAVVPSTMTPGPGTIPPLPRQRREVADLHSG